MPLSVLSSWKNDCARFLQDDHCALIHAHHGERTDREHNFYRWLKRTIVGKTTTNHQKWKVSIVFTTYDMILKDIDLFKQYNKWEYLVVDEAHRLKNKSATLFNLLNKIRTNHRLLLTGTPIQNNLNELWALLSFLRPKEFNSEQQFNEWFNKPFESKDDIEENSEENGVNYKGKSFCFQSPSKQSISSIASMNSLSQLSSLPSSSLLNDNEKITIITSLHRVIRPVILRRLKSEVAPDLPPKVIYIILLLL